MPTHSENNKRLAKNTLLLYARMLLTVGISFYSTRLILANLGVDNYGIYNVIGGFVSMFYMVTSTMTQAVGRFLTFELGAGNEKKLQQTFSTSVNILLLFALVVVVLAETVGLWFVNYKLNISTDRMGAANWIYQFSGADTNVVIASSNVHSSNRFVFSLNLTNESDVDKLILYEPTTHEISPLVLSNT